MLFLIAKTLKKKKKKRFLLIIWTVLVTQHIIGVQSYSVKRDAAQVVKDAEQQTTAAPLDVEYEADSANQAVKESILSKQCDPCPTGINCVPQMSRSRTHEGF